MDVLTVGTKYGDEDSGDDVGIVVESRRYIVPKEWVFLNHGADDY